MAGTATTFDPVRAAVRLEIKELDATARTFEGLGSTWDLDLGDDMIHRGAFKATLDAWRKKDELMPLFYGHNYRDVGALVGNMVDYRETKTGLWIKAELLEDASGEAVLLRMRKKILNGLSIGYRPVKVDFEESDDARFGQVRHIRELELHEISVVPFPMNTGSRIDLGTVKDMTREGLLELQEAVAGALKGGAVPPAAPPPAPAPPSDEEKGEGDAPDMALYDKLRVRALGFNPKVRR